MIRFFHEKHPNLWMISVLDILPPNTLKDILFDEVKSTRNSFQIDSQRMEKSCWRFSSVEKD